jgi:hypothetical protein
VAVLDHLSVPGEEMKAELFGFCIWCFDGSIARWDEGFFVITHRSPPSFFLLFIFFNNVLLLFCKKQMWSEIIKGVQEAIEAIKKRLKYASCQSPLVYFRNNDTSVTFNNTSA